jgi:ubiquinone/menaquinone biosynthesis C-methylase UbiE
MFGIRRRSPSSRARRRLDRRSGYGAGCGLERLTIRDSREWICRQARGRTLELAGGSGLNLRWYPGDIELVVVDIDPDSLEVSAQRVSEMGIAAGVAVADGQRLPFGSEAFDTMVCTLAMCEMDDRAATLAEAYRILRPGGSLLLLDHRERRWRQARPATVGEEVGFAVADRQRLWAGYFERVRLQKPGASGRR